MSAEKGAVVAWRGRDYAKGWRLSQNPAFVERVKAQGAIIEGLVRENDYASEKAAREEAEDRLRALCGDLEEWQRVAKEALVSEGAREAPGCMCRDVPIGSHRVSVLTDLPEHMADVRDARFLAGLSRQITVDACLVEEIRDLWSKGIRTTGCCCGHNRMAGYIGVEASDIPAMKAMGYVVRENASRLGDQDSFVPKSVRAHALSEAVRAKTIEECASLVQTKRHFHSRRGGYLVIGREAESAIADAIRVLGTPKAEDMS